MKWRDGRRSSNVQDRRGVSARPAMVGGGIGTIVIVLIALFMGVDPSVIFQVTDQLQQPAGQQQQQQPGSAPPASDDHAQFVSVVLADIEDTWHAIFSRYDEQYQEPRLVLFSGGVQSACGYANSAVGPFYCPGDHNVYLDLDFFDELKNQYGAAGDFAEAYVIAHEVGHHVQNLIGILNDAQRMKQGATEAQANHVQVMVELQADCYAGIWAHFADRTRQILEQGDLEEALRAANAIGDDTLQRQSQGYVVPDSFTHGTSAQRSRWFRVGFDNGDIGMCNTFNAQTL